MSCPLGSLDALRMHGKWVRHQYHIQLFLRLDLTGCKYKKVVIDALDQRKFPSATHTADGREPTSDKNSLNTRVKQGHCAHEARFCREIDVAVS